MKVFTLRLRKILLCDILYYLLLFLTIVYLFIYFNNFNVNCIYDITDSKFNLRIINYKIFDDKITINFDNNIIGKYYIKSKKEIDYFINRVSLNDELYLEGELSLPDNNTIPNTFDYKKYLYHKKIKYILNINNYNIKTKNKNIFYKIKTFIYKRINSINNNSYLYAFILGDSSHIDDDVYSNYKINGITHLFALSGLHVSMFSNILIYILNRLKFKEKTTFMIISIFLLFYSFIASFSPSILRATLFFILTSINKINYLFIKQKNILYLTFILLVIINPNYIFNTGFILSFTITFFIILYSEYNKTSSILKISLLSLLSSLPIIINMSYEINIIGFINNIFFIPFVSYIIFPLSLLTIIISKLNIILKLLTKIMEVISSFSSILLYIPIYIQKINNIEIIIYYILLILIVKKHNKMIKFFIIFLICLYIKPLCNNSNYIYYIDVSQGDSSLVVTKNNKSILIDTGGNNYDIMNSKMIPFFKSIGLKKIDYLILSHGDFDHIGYSFDLINNYKVKNVIFNCGDFNNLELKLIDLLSSKNINYDVCINELNVDGYIFYFLQTKNYDNENDNSNVIYVDINSYKLLFMADASITTEKEIMNKYNISNIDILKVGHHGSKTSSNKSFINYINPTYSIISVGKDNRYGHPNKEVLYNLKDSKIYRTDEVGSVMFKIKNNELTIETYSP